MLAEEDALDVTVDDRLSIVMDWGRRIGAPLANGGLPAFDGGRMNGGARFDGDGARWDILLFMEKARNNYQHEP